MNKGLAEVAFSDMITAAENYRGAVAVLEKEGFTFCDNFYFSVLGKPSIQMYNSIDKLAELLKLPIEEPINDMTKEPIKWLRSLTFGDWIFTEYKETK